MSGPLNARDLLHDVLVHAPEGHGSDEHIARIEAFLDAHTIDLDTQYKVVGPILHSLCQDIGFPANMIVPFLKHGADPNLVSEIDGKRPFEVFLSASRYKVDISEDDEWVDEQDMKEFVAELAERDAIAFGSLMDHGAVIDDAILLRCLAHPLLIRELVKRGLRLDETRTAMILDKLMHAPASRLRAYNLSFRTLEPLLCRQAVPTHAGTVVASRADEELFDRPVDEIVAAASLALAMDDPSVKDFSNAVELRDVLMSQQRLIRDLREEVSLLRRVTPALQEAVCMLARLGTESA